MSGIYFHIPFCKQACSYCDFYFETETSDLDLFVDRLVEEVERFRGTKYTEETVETIYFGGGTPSLLRPGQVEDILKRLDDVFDVASREVTFEMNPDDTSKAFLSDLYAAGINRISMGVQSFQPELLNMMNRAHSRKESFQSLELLGQSDFDSFTVDLLYGNPGESKSQLESDLENLLHIDPPHISAYSLTIEPNTRLGKQVDLGRIVRPSDDKIADQFDIINERLREHGMERYELSNYSRPGCEAIHNSRHWTHENYLGFGPGAHSFWWDEEAVRWGNEEHLQKYLHRQSEREDEVLSNQQLAEERLMMGLRTRDGVGIAELSEKYGYTLNDRQREYLQDQKEEGKIVLDDGIKLTDYGIKIADAIILDLITLH